MTPKLINRSLQTLFSVATFTAIFLATSSFSAKAITLVTNRDDLGANDKIDWSNLGFGTPIDLGRQTIANSLANSFDTSQKGLGLRVDITPTAGSTPFVFPTTPNLPTNFSDGDHILFTGFIPGNFTEGNPGPLTITFDQPIEGAGTQIAVDDTPQFLAFLSAFDDKNDLLGSFTLPGISASVLNNSAVFFGIRSDIANISKLVYSSSVNNEAIGINFLSIRSTSILEASNILALSVLSIGLLTARNKIFKV